MEIHAHLPGQLYASFLRSDRAHAKIMSINPEAPVRLSTMKFCPMSFWNATDSSRAWISVPPPGGNGTRIRTGLPGYCWAIACIGFTAQIAATAASARASFLIQTSSLFWGGDNVRLP